MRGASWRGRAATVLLLVLACAVPFLGLSNYTQRLLNVALVFSLLAISLNLLLGYAGQISLGHAAFFGIGAYAAALLTAGGEGWLFWPGFLLAGLATGLAGLAIGVPTLRLRGHYLALATLGFGEIMRLLFFNWREVTHGMDGIGGIPAPTLFGFAFDTETRMFFLVLAVLAVALLLIRNLDRSKYGRRLAAIRDAELAAGTSGVNVPRMKTGVFMASAMLAGFAGSLYAHLMTFISPDTFGFEVTAQILSMVVIGGIGTVAGPVLGAFVLTFLPEYLRVSNAYYQVIYGAGLVLMIILLPGGIWGAMRARLQRAAPVEAPPAEAGMAAMPADAAPAQRPRGEAILQTKGLTRRFGGLVAVDGLDLEVESGTIHALIGPNGSGKSTFINLASGIYRPSEGSIAFDGHDIGGAPPWRIAEAGLVRSFQNLRLFPSLTVEENVLVACRATRPAGIGAVLLALPRARAEERALRDQAAEAMQAAGVLALRDRIARTLPHEQQRLVEIARALAARPRLLLLDEPAAGMNPSESDRLVARIAALRERGLTILLVEHNMPIVMRLADRITVLNFGRKVAEGTPEAIRNDPAVIEAYLGRRHLRQPGATHAAADA